VTLVEDAQDAVFLEVDLDGVIGDADAGETKRTLPSLLERSGVEDAVSVAAGWKLGGTAPNSVSQNDTGWWGSAFGGGNAADPPAESKAAVASRSTQPFIAKSVNPGTCAYAASSRTT
jgi:hypothetical protein